MNNYINDYLDNNNQSDDYASGDLWKQNKYGFPIPITKKILQENKRLAFDKSMPPDELGRLSPFRVDKSPVSHNDKMNTLHAIDFLVPVATDILAVKDGIVKAIKEDSNEYGRGPEFGNKANYIDILHGDDIISEYIHLSGLSVSKSGLKVGDKVKTGQKIGETGMTGWINIPHLHFALYKKLGSGEITNIQVNFQKKLMHILLSLRV